MIEYWADIAGAASRVRAAQHAEEGGHAGGDQQAVRHGDQQVRCHIRASLT
jgi:hypothetical protein